MRCTFIWRVEYCSCRNFMSDENSCQTTTDLHMVQQPHNQFSSFWSFGYLILGEEENSNNSFAYIARLLLTDLKFFNLNKNMEEIAEDEEHKDQLTRIAIDWLKFLQSTQEHGGNFWRWKRRSLSIWIIHISCKCKEISWILRKLLFGLLKQMNVYSKKNDS